MLSYEKFRSKFIDEALDNIDELENVLMGLESTPHDKELLKHVFRLMHSLKGGGAMFGFERLSAFAHHMENMYDMIRAERMEVTPRVLALTFRSVDILRGMVSDNGTVSSKTAKLAAEVEEAVLQLTATEGECKEGAGVSTAEKNDTGNQINTWYIRFRPGPEVAANGVNLLYLTDELKSMGAFEAIPATSGIPEFDTLEPDRLYLYWDFLLATTENKQSIWDVFLFVEMESQIEMHLLGSGNLLGNEIFRQNLGQLKTGEKLPEVADFKRLARDMDDSSSNIQGERDSANNTSAYTGSRQTGSIRVSSAKIDALINLVSEMVITREKLQFISDKIDNADLESVTDDLRKLTGFLRDNTLELGLVPLESLTGRFRRLIRDLGALLDKQIDFEVKGQDTELDKSMIDSLADPLMHIIRNAADHGLEDAETRVKAGKPASGKITLEAGYSGAGVEISISDDGKGVDPQFIRKKSIEKGLLDPNTTLTQQELLEMIFLPGFSTNAKVTDVSGRGVGMDVVKRNIEALRGNTKVDSEPGKGTTIKITLPLVLSIIDGLLVSVDNSKYVLPLSVVDRIYSIDSDRFQNRYLEVVTLDESQVTFIDLRKILGVKSKLPPVQQIVTVRLQEQTIAIPVDRVVSKMQAVLKPLGRFYHHQKIVSAATIMGDGSVALVLDVNALKEEANLMQEPTVR